MRKGIAVVLATMWGVACGKQQPAPAEGTPFASASAALAAALASVSARRAHPKLPPSALPVRVFDAGTNGCRIAFGPAPLPLPGDMTLISMRDGVLVVTQKDGTPTVTPFSVDTKFDKANAFADGGPSADDPPCHGDADQIVCMDPSGALHVRATVGTGKDEVIARARPGTPFAVERIGTHLFVGYLADRQTTEGTVSEAYVATPGVPPIRVSDEGSGATDIDLAKRGEALIALTLDGRVAMTPAHARVVKLTVDGKGGVARLEQGEDAVIFVGGSAERKTRGVIGTEKDGPAFALIPVAGEMGFGMATVRLDDPPKTDEPVVWSKYPNGLDPAPIAATRGVTPIRVARVRPLEAAVNGQRGLELGYLDETGTFVSYGFVGSKGRVTNVAFVAAIDPEHFWLAFTDGTGAWLEERACPPALRDASVR